MPDGPPTVSPPVGSPYPPDHRGRSRAGVVVAVVAVLLLAVASIAFVTRDDGGGDGAAPDVGGEAGSPTTRPTDDGSATVPPSSTAAPMSEADFLALVETLEDYVAAARGIDFLTPVDVELADGAEFQDRLLQDFEDDIEDIEKAEVFYRALGLLDADADLAEELRSIYSAGVLGFYDPETNELVVRGTDATPYVQQTIVHELVHALDDQHFELDRPDYDDRPDEIGTGFTTIVEGNARRIENQWLGEQPADVRAQADREEAAFGAGIDVSAFPEILLFEIGAPYELGLNLVGQLARQGGERAVDAALADPPTTSEQILDTSLYESREPRVEVPAPPADGEIVDEGVVGALFLFGLLTTGDSTVSPTVASQAVRGWGGDWAVTWEDGDADCVRMDLVGDTDTDTDEIEDALRAWAEGGAASVGRVDGRVRVESCVAGGGAPPQV